MAAMKKVGTILISGNPVFQAPVTVNLHLGIDASDDQSTEGCNEADYISVAKSKAEDFYDHVSDPRCYHIGSYPKGRVLLINNQHFRRRREVGGTSEDEFHGITERKGSAKDLYDMSELWGQIGSSVTIERNLTAENIMKAVKNFSANKDQADFYVVMLMSHGRADDLLVGTQDGDVPVKTILDEIVHSKQMKGKPKLVFIQMCRGTEFRTAVDAQGSSDDNDIVDNKTWIRDMLDAVLRPRIQTDADPASGQIGGTKDVMLAFATQPNEVAFRNTECGSWFIQSIRKVFSAHAAKCDVINLMKMVKKDLKGRVVDNKKSQFHKGRNVMDFDETFGEKILRLFPGFPNPNKE